MSDRCPTCMRPVPRPRPGDHDYGIALHAAPHDAPALDRERPDTDDALALLDELRARFDQGHMLSWQDLLLAALGDARLPETGLREALAKVIAAWDLEDFDQYDEAELVDELVSAALAASTDDSLSAAWAAAEAALPEGWVITLGKWDAEPNRPVGLAPYEAVAEPYVRAQDGSDPMVVTRDDTPAAALRALAAALSADATEGTG